MMGQKLQGRAAAAGVEAGRVAATVPTSTGRIGATAASARQFFR